MKCFKDYFDVAVLLGLWIALFFTLLLCFTPTPAHADPVARAFSKTGASIVLMDDDKQQICTKLPGTNEAFLMARDGVTVIDVSCYHQEDGQVTFIDPQNGEEFLTLPEKEFSAVKQPEDKPKENKHGNI